MLVTVHSITPLTTTGTLIVYVDRLKEPTEIHLQHGFHSQIASTSNWHMTKEKLECQVNPAE